MFTFHHVSKITAFHKGNVVEILGSNGKLACTEDAFGNHLHVPVKELFIINGHNRFRAMVDENERTDTV